MVSRQRWTAPSWSAAGTAWRTDSGWIVGYGSYRPGSDREGQLL